MRQPQDAGSVQYEELPEPKQPDAPWNSHLYEVNETSATGTSLDFALYGEQRHGYEYEDLDDTTEGSSGV